MSLAEGFQLGPYEIVAPVGAGGMGEVSKDGKQFLVNRYVKPDHVDPLTVVLNATGRTKK